MIWEGSTRVWLLFTTVQCSVIRKVLHLSFQGPDWNHEFVHLIKTQLLASLSYSQNQYIHTKGHTALPLYNKSSRGLATNNKNMPWLRICTFASSVFEYRVVVPIWMSHCSKGRFAEKSQFKFTLDWWYSFYFFALVQSLFSCYFDVGLFKGQRG